MRVRLLALILAVLTLFSPLGMSVGRARAAEWSTDYRSWSQSDPLWGGQLINNKTMSSVGCLVVAVAKLMVHAGQRDPETFNPGICLAEMKEMNLFHGTNSMYIGELDDRFFPTYAPELTSVYSTGELDRPWTEKQAAENLSSFIENGYYVIVMTNTVRNTTHWMAVDEVVDGHVMVMDNRGVIDLYDSSQYNGVARYVTVKYTGKYAYPASEGVLAGSPEDPDPDRLDRTEVYSAPDQLRIRSTPSLSGSVIGGLSEGERVRIRKVTVGDGYVWGELDMGGWCAISLCSYLEGSLYYIFYDAGEGSDAPGYQPNPYGQAVCLSDGIPVWEGHTFLGWSTDPDAQTPEYSPGESVQVDDDLTLYAVWTPERCERYLAPDLLRVRSQPSLSSEKLRNLDEGSPVTVYEVVTADGYTWGRLADGGWCAISICEYVEGSLFYILYNASGGTGGPICQPNPTDQTVILSDQTPKRSGHRFMGYATAPDKEEPEYRPGDSVDLNADLTLYAIWGEACEHDEQLSVVPPTATEPGYTLHQCRLCGESYRSDYTDSLGEVRAKNGRLYLTKILAKDSLPGADGLSVSLDGVEGVLDPENVEITEKDGLTTVNAVVYGLPAVKDRSSSLLLTLGEASFEIPYTPAADSMGYDSATVTLYRKNCSIVLYTDGDLPYGSHLTGYSDETGKSYDLTVSYRSGRRLVLSCEDMDEGVRTLFFETGNFAVLFLNTSAGIRVLGCSEDEYFTPYYQTKRNDSNPALTDIRFLIVGNLKKLESVDSATVEICFYKQGALVNRLEGMLGGDHPDYRLFICLTAAGDIYAASDGTAIFGQAVYGIPSGAFDRITLRVTDSDSDNVLLDASLNTSV